MGKSKKVLRRAAGGILFFVLLAVMILRLDSALKLIQEDNLCPRYYKFPKNTFDVTFLGASFVMYGIYPMELYRDYGIASYNLSTGNQTMEASYYLAKESIEKDHPALIVLDTNMAWIGEETLESQYIHYITDTMPYFSRNRLDMIRNLSEKGEDLLPLYFPLIAFHSRWEELTYEDALPQAKEMEYGCKVTGRVDAAEPFDDPENMEMGLPEISKKYIEKTIELCRANDTQLLMISVPVIGKNKFFGQGGYNLRWTAANEVEKLAKENGVPCVNYFNEGKTLGLDVKTDTYDGEHFNRWGAAKLTAALGEYIHKNFDIPDRRKEGGAYKTIASDLEKYPVVRMKDSLNRALFLRDYAATLASDAGGADGDAVSDALVLVTLRGPVDGEILTKEDAGLLQKSGLKQNLSQWEGHSWIAVIDGGKVVYESAPKEDDFDDSYEGVSGKLRYKVSSGRVDEETGKIRTDASIMVNGLEYTSENRGLHFAVFDKTTGELMDSCYINIHSRALDCTHDNH